MVKRIVKVLLMLCAALVAIFVLFLAYMTASDYRPAAKIVLKVDNNQDGTVSADTPISITTFNIGYCGLDKDENFFMDGANHIHILLDVCLKVNKTVTLAYCRVCCLRLIKGCFCML